MHTEFTQVVRVTFGELNETIAEDEKHTVENARMCSVTDLLEMIAHLELKDQVYMVSNILTVSGYTQKEIAEALGVSHKTYRNRLWEIRKDMLQLQSIE